MGSAVQIILAILANLGTIYKLVELIVKAVKDADQPAEKKAEIIADLKRVCDDHSCEK